MIRKENYYSIYDTQLKKLGTICNKSSMSDAISALRSVLSNDGDISDVSDKELFNNWGYILIKHNSHVIPNNKIEWFWLRKIIDFKIIYNTKFL